MAKGKTVSWENWLIFGIGVWLMLAPWVLPGGYSYGRMLVPSWNLWISGVIVLVGAGLALRRFRPWEEWINLVAGTWVLVSPWVLRYSGVAWFSWTSVVSGLTIVALSVVSLAEARRGAS